MGEESERVENALEERSRLGGARKAENGRGFLSLEWRLAEGSWAARGCSRRPGPSRVGLRGGLGLGGREDDETSAAESMRVGQECEGELEDPGVRMGIGQRDGDDA